METLVVVAEDDEVVVVDSVVLELAVLIVVVVKVVAFAFSPQPKLSSTLELGVLFRSKLPAVQFVA